MFLSPIFLVLSCGCKAFQCSITSIHHCPIKLSLSPAMEHAIFSQVAKDKWQQMTDSDLSLNGLNESQNQPHELPQCRQ